MTEKPDIKAAEEAAKEQVIKEIVKSFKKNALNRGKPISSKTARELATRVLEEAMYKTYTETYCSGEGSEHDEGQCPCSNEE